MLISNQLCNTTVLLLALLSVNGTYGIEDLIKLPKGMITIQPLNS